MEYKDDCSLWVRKYLLRPTPIAGRIVQMEGNMVYQVSVGSEAWVRHANWQKATLTFCNETRHRVARDVLMDTLEIRTPETYKPVSVQGKSDTTLIS